MGVGWLASEGNWVRVALTLEESGVSSHMGVWLSSLIFAAANVLLGWTLAWFRWQGVWRRLLLHLKQKEA